MPKAIGLKPQSPKRPNPNLGTLNLKPSTYAQQWSCRPEEAYAAGFPKTHVRCWLQRIKRHAKASAGIGRLYTRAFWGLNIRAQMHFVEALLPDPLLALRMEPMFTGPQEGLPAFLQGAYTAARGKWSQLHGAFCRSDARTTLPMKAGNSSRVVPTALGPTILKHMVVILSF